MQQDFNENLEPGELHIKLFPLDKNYILKEAQWAIRDQLLANLLEYARGTYLSQYNPLGISDEITDSIANDPGDISGLYEFYKNLATIYRFKHGENQLEIIFDGVSHLDKYRDEWEQSFMEWVREFCDNFYFLKAVFEAAIFFPKDRKCFLASNRLNVFLNKYFELKVYKYRGVKKFKAA